MLNILSEAGITLKPSSDTAQATTRPLSDGKCDRAAAASLVKSIPSASALNLVGSSEVPQLKPSSVDKSSVHSDSVSEGTPRWLRGGGLPKSDPSEIRPIDGGCECRGVSLSDPPCIQDCGPTNSDCLLYTSDAADE